jgi:putative DNA primase/helicase
MIALTPEQEKRVKDTVRMLRQGTRGAASIDIGGGVTIPSETFHLVQADFKQWGLAASDAEIYELIEDARADLTMIAKVQAPPELAKQSRAAWLFNHWSGSSARYDFGRKGWLIWAGHRWQPDPDGSIERMWLQTMADRYRSAVMVDDDKFRTAAFDDIRSAGLSNSAVKAGLELASVMKPIATAGDLWDRETMVLCCENGVIDLQKGRLRPGRPEDMISRSTLVSYDPRAKAPRWLKFLDEVFAGDKDLVAWFQLLIGSSLHGEVTEILPILYGRGSNGKSVCIKALRGALGDYAETIGIETLVNAKREAGQATPDLMRLRGTRLAFTSEPDKTARLQGGTLKRLVNIDRMSARGLYGDQVSWEPTHSLFLATNHLPETDDVTDSFWRRIALVPFTVHFGKAGEDGPLADEGLSKVLAAEAPGILAWAVQGCVRVIADPPSVKRFPPAVQAQTEAYRTEEDPLSAFVEDRLVFDPKEWITLAQLFETYQAWCTGEGVPDSERLKSRAFRKACEDRDQRLRFRRGTGRGYGLFTRGCTVRTAQGPCSQSPYEEHTLESYGTRPLNGASSADPGLLPIEDEYPPSALQAD